MNATTTITPEQANELYDLRRNKAWSWYELANRYGITEAETRRVYDRMNIARINAAQGIDTFDVEEETTIRAYATMDDILAELYGILGADAINYDVFSIANEVSEFKDGLFVADLTREDLPLIIAMHVLTEDWHDSVELPEGTDTDVATIVNACTHTVRKTGSCTGADTITEWFQWVCTGDDLVHDLIHLLVRATRMTSEWRSAVSPLDAERDRVGAWYEAMRLCDYKDADVTDSALFCRALHIVESDPNWFFHCVVF
jgi:hypothetical protein